MVENESPRDFRIGEVEPDEQEGRYDKKEGK